MLIDTKVSSESFMRSCRSLEKEWFRLDGNWNAEISSSALRMVLGKDITDRVLDSVSSPSDQLEHLLSHCDEDQEKGKDADIHLQETVELSDRMAVIEEDTHDDDQVMSPPALYHRSQEEMQAILGFVTHAEAQRLRLVIIL